MSTTFKIKPFSDNYAVPFGTLSQSSSELMDNLKTVIKQIMEGDAIPGGFQNVRAMYLGTSTVGAVPLYICEGEAVQFHIICTLLNTVCGVCSRIVYNL